MRSLFLEAWLDKKGKSQSNLLQVGLQTMGIHRSQQIRLAAIQGGGGGESGTGNKNQRIKE